MCGITAVVRLDAAPLSASSVQAMTDAVAHRGPDGAGVRYYHRDGDRLSAGSEHENWCVALGHRRLAILDVSDAGLQPMSYGDRLWIVFNGEVYNYLELRRELVTKGYSFRSGTDTEVILASYQEWGTDCFRRFRGMWGLAIVDLAVGRMILSRDRLGIKPLYRYQTHDAIYLASEIKQFIAAGLPLRPRESAVGEYLLTGYESTDATFFDDVSPIPAGTWCEIDLRSGRIGMPQDYWHPETTPFTIDDRDDAANRIRRSLEESTLLHLRSDVPVGCALSGGLDSSSIAAILASRPEINHFNTFTVSFPGTSIDESKYASMITASGQMVPHVVTPTADDFLRDFDRFVWIHDEPVGSLSQYAGYALARLTHEAGVPVTLNGQGGDESLLGYWQSYFSFLYGRLRRGDIITPVAHLFGSLLPGGNSELVRQIPLMWRRYRTRSAAADQLNLTSLQRRFGNQGSDRIRHVLRLDERSRRLYELRNLHLPRLLKWDDRNLMAFSVEGRYPFLDHEFVEAALACSERTMYRRGWTKEPLRQAMQDILPATLLRRRDKNGFETPQADWLCGPLRSTLETWLGSDAPLWDYVDPAEARNVATLTWNSGGAFSEAAQSLMRMFIADRWLRVFFADGSLAASVPRQLAS